VEVGKIGDRLKGGASIGTIPPRAPGVVTLGCPDWAPKKTRNGGEDGWGNHPLGSTGTRMGCGAEG